MRGAVGPAAAVEHVAHVHLPASLRGEHRMVAVRLRAAQPQADGEQHRVLQLDGRVGAYGEQGDEGGRVDEAVCALVLRPTASERRDESGGVRFSQASVRELFAAGQSEAEGLRGGRD